MKKINVIPLLLFSPIAISATPIDLAQQKPFLFSQTLNTKFEMKETSRITDFNHTLHIREQQYYQGYPVLGADSVTHIPFKDESRLPKLNLINPQTKMNGTVYDNLQADLSNLPPYLLTETQQQKAIAYALSSYQKNLQLILHPQKIAKQLIVFIDKENKAHWAYQISFLIRGKFPKKPVYIIDAINLITLATWNDLKTSEINAKEKVEIGGFGGNHKTGKKIFDGEHQMSLKALRDESHTCYLKNELMRIKDYRKGSNIMYFKCEQKDPAHNNVYWRTDTDQIETTWSPSNDAMFGTQVAYSIFNEWYKIPVLSQNKKPLVLPVTVHDPVENAFYEDGEITLGDSVGSQEFNPFTQLDTVVHEICHGFTEQHSGLLYRYQSGGLNEAFSDMAGIVAEYFAYGKTEFLIGNGDVKEEGKILRYMDQPSKDCYGKKPGDFCSIDKLSQYTDNLNVHFSSGIFNHVYYLLATSPNWNPKKAFDVMVQANINYWTSNIDFTHAACGVISATKDYGYEVESVIKAFNAVEIDTRQCK